MPIVNNMLTLARMDVQRGPMHQDLPDLSDLALDVVARLVPLAVRQN